MTNPLLANWHVSVETLVKHYQEHAQAGMPNKRLAQSKLVRMVLNQGEALASPNQIGP